MSQTLPLTLTLSVPGEPGSAPRGGASLPYASGRTAEGVPWSMRRTTDGVYLLMDIPGRRPMRVRVEDLGRAIADWCLMYGEDSPS